MILFSRRTPNPAIWCSHPYLFLTTIAFIIERITIYRPTDEGALKHEWLKVAVIAQHFNVGKHRPPTMYRIFRLVEISAMYQNNGAVSTKMNVIRH